MSYKLELPPSVSIHPVFHVSQLKQHVGNKKVFEELPTMADESSLQPQTLLDRRIVKHRNRAATQILVLWKGLSPAEATGEFLEEVMLRFPESSLEDKGVVWGGNCCKRFSGMN
jgi:hypothetical protein